MEEEMDLEKKLNEIDEKYYDLFLNLILEVVKGKINSYEELEKEYNHLQSHYSYELMIADDYRVGPSLCQGFKKLIRREKENNVDVYDFARRYSWISGKVEEALKKKKYSFIDDKENICDEYGNRLSEDGEHRVFEPIKGSGEEKSEHKSTLGIVKGNTEL